ncbi:beta-beta-carotene 9 -10 -oxygenase-like [Brachionus plicatilis]|uniref:Beta-beta-carotene 9-10-oxygenase-like n=1 Tax=Brachionus plicatilis TaxID=10195 RepID=A0A3M7PJ51_BRAPC|nr:beta-beta-carotene 9 -10 -oxygenase-like [Brachionus plicatilis]
MHKNHFLRSLKKNEQSLIETKIVGTIPEWVNGTLFRNGPGRYSYGDKTYNHLFDGHALVHKFRIMNGKIFYSNKFLETQSYKKSLSESRLYPVFGTVDKLSTLLERLELVVRWPKTLDNVNINLVPYGTEKIFALTETNVMYELNPSNLNLIKRVEIDKCLDQATTTMAHPHYLEDGSWITLGMNFKNLLPHYDFIKYNYNEKEAICEKAELIARIPSSHYFGLSYFHSFGLTENFIIFLEQSIKFDITSLLNGIVFNEAFSEAFHTLENFPTRIHVIGRKNGAIVQKKFFCEPLVVFHHINSYEVFELDGTLKGLVTDVCAYDPKHFEIKNFTYENMNSETLLGTDAIKSTARRIFIPMNEAQDEIECVAKKLNQEVIFDLPTINYARFNGKEYSYVYGANYFKLPFSIIKMNVQNPKEVFERKYDYNKKSCLPSEPIFVESLNPVREDDGVLLVMVLCDEVDFLSILDAKDLKEIARGELPKDVKSAFTFHGFFAPKTKFELLNKI